MTMESDSPAYHPPLHFRLGNWLYRNLFPAYRPIYMLWKTITERHEIKWLKGQIPPGVTVVDVGANIGFYVRLMADWVGEEGTVLALEPEVRNLQHLEVCSRKLPQVQIIPKAAAGHSGHLTLHASTELNVDHRIYPGDGAREAVDVPCIRIDDLLMDREVHLILVDVQGAEMFVLEGMSEVLQRKPAPLLVMEFWPHGLKQAGSSPDVMLTTLKQAGYTTHLLEQGRLVEIPEDIEHAPPTSYFTLVASQPEGTTV